MDPRKRKHPIATRRRANDDGEEEEDDIPILDDDSSVGTIPSDAEHEADVEEEISDVESLRTSKKKSSRRANGNEQANIQNGNFLEQLSATKEPDFSVVSADTIAMMNGLDIDDTTTNDQTVEFGDNPQQVPTEVAAGAIETLGERRKREHEEYKRKRDADPAFVPNRGGFFMHDSRNNLSGTNGFRGGRGRGRASRGGLQFGPNTPSSASDAPWAHDLHETVVDVEPPKQTPVEQSKATTQAPLPIRPPVPPLSSTPPNRTFSRTIQVGNVNLRVLLPHMESPITFSAVPVHAHTRLPHHRPPLRRDKPVRISLPDNPPRYIFPATDRSFIFIPRAMRPNQQGFGRSRGRGSFTGYGNFSARNSIFGGSMYTPSISMSRRSSMAREIGREGMASPAGSAVSRNIGNMADQMKPVVRLPPSMDPAMYAQYTAQQMQLMANSNPVNFPQAQSMGVPQQPATQNYAGPIPMHQPRPQKQIAVADIESPAALNFPPPQVQQQPPFHHQVPASLGGQSFAAESVISSHSRRTSHPSQQGTPLSQIPERAIHAQSFQPTYQYQQPQAYYAQQFAAPVYFYASTQPMASAVAAPPFIPGQQYPYMVPSTPMAQPEAIAQPGTVAHESNGMVYYYDSSQLAVTAPEDPALYQQIAYVPPTGYVMAPQGAVYYPTQ